MNQPPPPKERLDAPLVWEGSRSPAGTEGRRHGDGAGRWSRLRLFPAFLADLGVVLAGLGVAYGVAWWRGATLSGPQVVAASVAGVLISAVVGIGALWAWRATLGMMLLGGCFARPLRLGRAVTLWFALLAALPVAGIPLLVGGSQESLAERLAASELSFRSPPGSA